MHKLQKRAIIPQRIKALIELSVWLILALTLTLMMVADRLSVNGCIWAVTLLLIGIFLSSWRNFKGGRHPCVLFLGMLLIFQGGRLIAYIFGVLSNPMDIEVATPVPLAVNPHAEITTLLLILISAICIYAPSRFEYQPVQFSPGYEKKWLPALYVLVVLTFPFALEKNWLYLSYIQSHGGYLAVYTDNADLLQSAGFAIRSLALINNTALILTYVFERRPKRIFIILFLYFLLSGLDLLIGFRGKFFSQALGLWYIHKLKTGRRFKPLPLIVTAILASILAVVIGGFREERSIELLSPLGFIAQQGISLNVTESAVAYYDLFHRYGLSYLWGGLIYGIVPPPASINHQLWTNDLTNYLNPVAADLGFGTASSYLAELYLAGGTFAVIIGSVIVGFILRYLHVKSKYAFGAALMAFLLPPLIYMPRLEFFGPLAALVRIGIGFVPVLIFLVIFNWGILVIRRLMNIKTNAGLVDAKEA